MSSARSEATNQEDRRESSSSSSSSISSTSNSISLIKLDELSSFGATKQARLPALIKLNPLADLNSRDQQQQQPTGPTNSNSMPDFSGSQLEKMATGSAPAADLHQQSLPATLEQVADKENSVAAEKQATSGDRSLPVTAGNQDESVDGFQVVEMSMAESEMIGPSLPPPSGEPVTGDKENQPSASEQLDKSLAAASLLSRGQQQQYASHLGDSLIEMIINLRDENQNLIKALEVNNSYVKERLSEFKRCQEEAKKREAQYQLEKADLEHNLRKVQRQNSVLSERLKSMEAKLKDMKLEVSESLSAAHSSKASSIRGGDENLYPQLGEQESFSNSAIRQEPTTMQVDATSGELYNDGDHQSNASAAAGGSKPMDTDQTVAKELGDMSREELSKRFDAKKSDFYAMDDPMKQCDQLEQQLNDIGKRDYEICLLQQQLNIYRQDFRLERMAKLEAKIQIEKLKNEIDRLCLERLNKTNRETTDDEEQDERQRYGPTPATAAADGLIGKLGHHISRKALKSAAKAAKYASKQAHLEEKAAAALARVAAAKAAAASHYAPQQAAAAAPDQAPGQEALPGEPPAGPHSHHHSRRGHHHHGRPHHHPHPHHAGPHHRGPRGIRGEIVNDLMHTANKAMLTGYNLASTTINSALDKLSQFEQQQAAHGTDPNKPRPGANIVGAKPTAPPMDSQPSMD